MLKYFDSHCHPQMEAFDEDREAVLARMKETGTGGLVVGTDLKKSREAIALSDNYDFLWAAVGLHPNDLDEEFDEAAFRKLAEHKRVVAIGECGLDYFRNEPTQEERVRQHSRFKKHLALAQETRKPLVIHCRPTKGGENAHEEMLSLLSGETGVCAIMHFFTSTPDIANRYLALGHHISFPGVITFTGDYDDTVRAVPLERVLSETDSPFAAPSSHRGKRNEPVYVSEVVAKLSELKALPIGAVEEQVLKNTLSVFGLDR